MVVDFNGDGKTGIRSSVCVYPTEIKEFSIIIMLRFSNNVLANDSSIEAKR